MKFYREHHRSSHNEPEAVFCASCVAYKDEAYFDEVSQIPEHIAAKCDGCEAERRATYPDIIGRYDYFGKIMCLSCIKEAFNTGTQLLLKPILAGDAREPSNLECVTCKRDFDAIDRKWVDKEKKNV